MKEYVTLAEFKLNRIWTNGKQQILKENLDLSIRVLLLLLILLSVLIIMITYWVLINFYVVVVRLWSNRNQSLEFGCCCYYQYQC